MHRQPYHQGICPGNDLISPPSHSRSSSWLSFQRCDNLGVRLPKPVYFGILLCLYPSDRVCPFVNSIHSQVPSGFYTATAVPVSLPANAASMRMSSYNDLRYISLLSIRFCRSEGNHTSDETHICPCSSYYPFAFILLIGCKDRHLNAISNPPVDISAYFLLDIKYLQSQFSNFCWTVVSRILLFV